MRYLKAPHVLTGGCFGVEVLEYKLVVIPPYRLYGDFVAGKIFFHRDNSDVRNYTIAGVFVFHAALRKTSEAWQDRDNVTMIIGRCMKMCIKSVTLNRINATPM